MWECKNCGEVNEDINENCEYCGFIENDTYSHYAKPKEASGQENEKQKDTRVFSCPSCNQKTRISLPLLGDILKCAKCRTRIRIRLDESGNLYILPLLKGKLPNTETTLILDDCFSILEIDSNLISDEIKSAYKKKMKEYHPDKVSRLGTKLITIAEEETKRINAAYLKLKEYGFVKKD